MDSGIDFTVVGLRELFSKYSPARMAAGNERALLSASSIIIEQSKKNHIHTRRSGVLETSPDAEASGNSVTIGVPTSGSLGVSYARWIYTGVRKNKEGKVVARWNGGKGDPFIRQAYKDKRPLFLKKHKTSLIEQLQAG